MQADEGGGRGPDAGDGRSGRRWLATRYLAIDPILRRVGAAHLVALAIVLLILAVDQRPPIDRQHGLGLGLFAGLGLLRTTAYRRRVATSTIALDAAASAVILAGTGAPASPFFVFALAGAWWGAHALPGRRGMLWGAWFVVVYLLLVIPSAVADRALVHALEDVSVVLIVGVLSDSFVRVDRRAVELSEAIANVPAGAEKVAIREGLNRALGPTEISLDVLLAAAKEGLTVIQAELLAYLVLGLSNAEIAEATSVSEATVRYRLTRLYRALGVRGRRQAIARAHELGGNFEERVHGADREHSAKP